MEMPSGDGVPVTIYAWWVNPDPERSLKKRKRLNVEAWCFVCQKDPPERTVFAAFNSWTICVECLRAQAKGAEKADMKVNGKRGRR